MRNSLDIRLTVTTSRELLNQIDSDYKQRITKATIDNLVASTQAEDGELKPDQLLRAMNSIIECSHVVDMDPNTYKEFKKIVGTVTNNTPFNKLRSDLQNIQYSFNENNSAAKSALATLGNVHGGEFDKMPKLTELYKRTDSRDENSFNSLISAFGTNFHDFNELQLVAFTRFLAHAGLNQEDIFEAVVERMEQLYDSNLEKAEDEQAKIHFRFN
eukprot:CAMPEP_0176389280 /NCGR_PEP_ID=MMETSP0126-20121128/38252_1 /TAXON_ID=141414 ORGANISM="Strombidinopsis acuminatum, Strain SPMC142" /NCGR_SAMPLE_ID=MMETSP0126 /ASSEMBLY_ACC=CAM_ASM_000229 /LENGTH=214 /DNA_ID=CAMNT_0017758003 /DNA_START=47 /DNA_END=691 /DNA_ORIENTATION=+